MILCIMGAILLSPFFIEKFQVVSVANRLKKVQVVTESNHLNFLWHFESMR